MTCLCRYLTPARAAATGVDITNRVCVFCSRQPGVSFPPEPVPDPRAGMCIEDGCPQLDRNGWGGRCFKHAIEYNRSSKVTA